MVSIFLYVLFVAYFFSFSLFQCETEKVWALKLTPTPGNLLGGGANRASASGFAVLGAKDWIAGSPNVYQQCKQNPQGVAVPASGYLFSSAPRKGLEIFDPPPIPVRMPVFGREPKQSTFSYYPPPLVV